MNIEALLASGVERAFTILKDLVKLGDYYQALSGPGSGGYDPVTDTTVTPTQTFLNVRMLKVSVDAEELIGTQVVVNDVKILIPAKDLAIDPNSADHIFLQGLRYNIVQPKPIPGKALHILYCREA